MLTFLLYASFHLSRKPISIVKVRDLHTQGSARHLLGEVGGAEGSGRGRRKWAGITRDKLL